MTDSVDNLPASHTTPRFLPQGRCVILLHSLPDGTSHFDWLSESASGTPEAGNEERSLNAFRAARSIDALQPGQSLLVDQLPNHRRLYLDYEGSISGERGSVRRLAAGVIEHASEAADGARLQIRWHHAGEAESVIQSLEIRVQTESRWLARCETRVPAAE